MSIDVYYDKNDPESFDKVLHSRCACGHQLYEHGNVFGFNHQYLSLLVSQCVRCNCKEFHSEESKDVH